MATKAYSDYRTANVETTDQGKLILICYDVAIKSCVLARDCQEKNDTVERAKRIYKAQDAITELMVALNMDKGGVFAKRLYALYDYFNWRLSEANVQQSIPMLDEVLNHLRSLREAWSMAIDKIRRENAPALSADRPSLSIVG